jgi:AP-1 complex subunit beta-1
MVDDQGFMEMLKDLLSDSSPMVVSNAVAALSEIQDSGGEPFEIDSHTLQKLLNALNECSEWGQIFILDALAMYDPTDAREAENIMERVSPRLAHANSAVVLSATKIIMKYVLGLLLSPFSPFALPPPPFPLHILLLCLP